MRRESYLSQPQQLEIYDVDGSTDIIMRKNIAETEKENVLDGGKIQKYTVWECDEVQLKYNGVVSADEVEKNFDYWFAKADEAAEPENMTSLTLEDAKKAKLKEVSEACENTIYAGVDVSTSSGIEHFSLTEKDQLNLFGKKMQLIAGEEKMEYHEDGEPCKYFSAEDMQKIIDKAMFWVSYNTTYCNALNMMIKAATSAEEVEKMSWGMEVPEEFQNEVLKDYMKKIVL